MEVRSEDLKVKNQKRRKAVPRKRKNSLVNNINKRKKAGTSRSKKKSTISKANYSKMKKGWKKK